MANALILWPVYSDVGVTYSPTGTAKASWPQPLPLANAQDRRLHKVARSQNAELNTTRQRWDLGVDRAVRGVVVPKHTISSSGKWRVLGVPSTQLFNYEAGDDIAALGGTFARAPTATVRAATYVDEDGVLKYAGENRCLRSETFDNATWVKTTTTVAADSIAAPDGTTTADTLTATAGNATTLQSITTTAVSWTFSVWLKRLTGTGNVQITMDGSTFVTKTLTTDWQRFSVTQTGVAGSSTPGIRIVTNADAVYAWGAQAEIGSAATTYMPTTSASVGAPRDGHYTAIGGSRTILLEGARTNLVTTGDIGSGSWGDIGTPTVASATGPDGVATSGHTITDNDGAVAERRTITVTFTGDAVKAVSIWIQQGNSTTSYVELLDTTAAVQRLGAAITWNGGSPGTPAMAAGTFLGKVQGADGWWWLAFSTAAVTAANTNSLRLYGTGNSSALTGYTSYAFPQCEDATFPSSTIPTAGTTVARGADTLSFPYTPVPQAGTVDVKAVSYEPSNFLGTYLWQIGTAAGTRWSCHKTSGAATLTGTHSSAAGTVTSTATTTTAVGDTIEARTPLAATGTITQASSVNGAAETVGTTSAANALDAAWAATTIYLNADASAGNIGFNAFQYLRITAGVQTLATMQAVVSDSGWLDAWPSGIDAEESEGMNLPLVKILSSDFTGRYWSVQFSDASNAAGYVDVGRLLVCGGFQPTINMSYGAQLGVETMTSREISDGGAAYYYERPRFRRFIAAFENVAETEAMEDWFDFFRIAGTHKQFYFVFDPNDTTHMHRRSFLATLEKLSPLQMPYLTRHSVAFEIREEL